MKALEKYTTYGLDLKMEKEEAINEFFNRFKDEQVKEELEKKYREKFEYMSKNNIDHIDDGYIVFEKGTREWTYGISLELTKKGLVHISIVERYI